jgi:hypothetical protein
MGARRLARVTGHVVASRAASTVHARRRRRSPQAWTSRDPHRIHWVAPDEVAATTPARIDESLRGRILDGDWDLAVLPLRTLTLWRGLEQRIVDGRDWQDTDLAQGRFVAEAPNVGTRLADCDPDALVERLRRLDALIAALRREGWLPHHDVGATFAREMAVAVTRSGALVRNSGGLHRLIVAQLIGLDRIPCRILVEHPDAPRPDRGLSRRRTS